MYICVCVCVCALVTWCQENWIPRYLNGKLIRMGISLLLPLFSPSTVIPQTIRAYTFNSYEAKSHTIVYFFG